MSGAEAASIALGLFYILKAVSKAAPAQLLEAISTADGHCGPLNNPVPKFTQMGKKKRHAATKLIAEHLNKAETVNSTHLNLSDRDLIPNGSNWLDNKQLNAFEVANDIARWKLFRITKTESGRIVDGDFNEPNAVDVTTGGETATHASLDWKSLTSFLTSSASSDLGSMTDESLALSRTVVPKNVETSLDADSILGVTVDGIGLAKESWRKYISWLLVVDNALDGYDDLRPNTNLEEILSFAFHETPPIVRLVLKVCTITFPPRLFDQPILMRCQRIFDPG